MTKVLTSCLANQFWRAGFVFVFLFSLSIIYTKNQANGEKIAKVIDRVCEIQIDKAKAKKQKKDGHTYYFCSKRCKIAFKKNPEKYVCICPSSSDGCNCLHCTGTGELCDCAEITVYTESHSGGHTQEQEDKQEGGGHGH